MIPSILDGNGTRHFQNKNITLSGNSRLLDQPQGVSHRMDSFLGKLMLPTISDSQKCELNAPIFREKALLALKGLQSSKAPGPDGLRSEFYQEFLPFHIREDQTGFIKCRSSSYNVRRLLHIINTCQTQEIDSMVISLDAEKAFDRVEWPCLYNVLHKFKLGDNFIRWVKLLYKIL